MKKKDNEFKIYLVIFYSIILYSVLFTLQNIPIKIFNLNNFFNDLTTYYIIYHIFSIILSILFFLNKIKKSYDKIIKQGKLYLIGLGSITIYFLFSEIQLLPFQLFNININTIPLYLKIIYLLCYEAILIGIIIIMNLKKLKKDFSDIKQNHTKYFKNCLKYWLISLFIMYMSNLLLSFVNSGIAQNEEIIRQQFLISPIYIFLSAVLFAPILEELIFRQSFRNLINNKWLFIIISGLVFGGMHVFNGSDLSLIDKLYIIPYSAPGMAFAYMLYKTDNIFVSIGFHTLHNGIMLSLQFLMVYFL